MEKARLQVYSTVEIVNFKLRSPRAQLRGEQVTKMVKNPQEPFIHSARVAKLSLFRGSGARGLDWGK